MTSAGAHLPSDRRKWILSTLIFLICSAQIKAQFSITLQPTNTTCGNPNGVIFVQTAGGKGPYTYTDNGGTPQNVALFTAVAAGVHNIVVRDANGNVATKGIVITNTNAHPTITATGMNPTDCKTFDGSITITSASGTAPFLYSVDGTNYVPTLNFPNLSTGGYTVSVKDNNFCIGSTTVALRSPCLLIVRVTPSAPVCGSFGTLTVTLVTGGSGTYKYSLDGVVFTDMTVFSKLAPGNYHLYTQDQASMFVSITAFSIKSHCDLTIDAVSSTQSRCSENNGTITINATQGRKPLFYSVVGQDYQESNVLQNLAPGKYDVEIVDANGNIGITTGVVVGSFCPVLQLSATPTACTSNTGVITVTNATGTAPITYSKDGTNFLPDKTFGSLPAGTYTITSKDANGILTTSTINVATAPNPVVTLAAKPTGCTVQVGEITATSTSGLAPYSYQLNNNASQTTNNFGSLAQGDYTVKVTDANGCSTTEKTTVNVSPPPSLTASTTESGCTVKNGSVVATATGGTGSILYSLGNGTPQASGTFKLLGSGTYAIKAVDENGCSVQDDFTVGTVAGPVLTVNATNASCANNDGTVSSSATGIAQPFLYSIDSTAFKANGNFTGLDSGNHQVVVKDANGCSSAGVTKVLLTNTIILDAGDDLAVCKGSSIRLSGTANGKGLWSPAASLDSPQTLSPRASPQTTTKYTLTVKLGACTSKDSTLVRVNPLPVANAGQAQTICSGSSTQLNGSGGISFTWEPSDFLSNDHIADPLVNSPAHNITYALKVQDNNGCISEPSFVAIQLTPPPRVSAGNDTSVLTGMPFTLIATDVDNNHFASYSWSPASGLNNALSATPIATLTQGQTFVVTAKTSAGCIGRDSVTIKVFQHADLFVPNAFTPNNDGLNDKLRIIPIGIQHLNRFSIYNRDGQMVFETSNATEGWDGLINGIPQNPATYVWLADGIDINGNKIHRQGTATLVR